MVRAAVLPAVGAPLEIASIELPEPGPGQVRKPDPSPGEPEFNPLRWPPCECARCRSREDDAAGDSTLIRQLRARVVEENGLRSSLRRTR
ncbi:hypothetical protein PUR34_05290 [Streptomyces sp. JV185]|uniref:hypothetical protein n=1 Tax=Streptomyces sp. JV185 TaxID=858638 RepID=UPI002E77865E|nr:hypothetical protein [Streptomyces sp. JV185]MEE1767607.1 hypothetical protein [Streptomyces sp. JV185]